MKIVRIHHSLTISTLVWHPAVSLQLISQLSSNNGSLFVPLGNGEGPANQTCFTRLRNGTVVEEIKQGALLYQEIQDKDYQIKEWYRDLVTTLVESEDEYYEESDQKDASSIPSNETWEQYDPDNKWSTCWFTDAPATRQSYVYPLPLFQSEQLKYESVGDN